MELGGASWDSTGYGTMEEGLISRGRRNLRLPLRFCTVQLSHPYMATGKTIALTRWTFVGKVIKIPTLRADERAS